MPTIRMNVSARVDSAKIQKTKRNGRDIIVLPSATLPDNVIMNGVRYPADEISRSFKTLDKTLAPLGHPVLNGKFVSASDPEAMAVNWIGAWNENVRRENGRVLLDKVVDVKIAETTEGGRRFLAAIAEGKPIHTSTGVVLDLEPTNAADHKFIGRNMRFDHDAILLDNPGAATPAQGVGIFVNAQNTAETLDVFTCALADSIIAASEQDAATSSILEWLRRLATGSAPKGESTVANANDTTDLAARLVTLEAALTKLSSDIGTLVTNAVTSATKPLVDAAAAQAAQSAAAEASERETLVAAVVKANMLDEVTAKAAALPVLRALKANIKVGNAAGAAAGNGGEADPWAGYSLNSHIIGAPAAGKGN